MILTNAGSANNVVKRRTHAKQVAQKAMKRTLVLLLEL
jgi:hypothetical protein